MRRIAARWRIAMMAEMKAIWDLAFGNLVGYAVGAIAFFTPPEDPYPLVSTPAIHSQHPLFGSGIYFSWNLSRIVFILLPFSFKTINDNFRTDVLPHI